MQDQESELFNLLNNCINRPKLNDKMVPETAGIAQNDSLLEKQHQSMGSQSFPPNQNAKDFNDTTSSLAPTENRPQQIALDHLKSNVIKAVKADQMTIQEINQQMLCLQLAKALKQQEQSQITLEELILQFHSQPDANNLNQLQQMHKTQNPWQQPNNVIFNQVQQQYYQQHMLQQNTLLSLNQRMTQPLEIGQQNQLINALPLTLPPKMTSLGGGSGCVSAMDQNSAQQQSNNESKMKENQDTQSKTQKKVDQLNSQNQKVSLKSKRIKQEKSKKVNSCGHLDLPHYAKGMCSNCYHKHGRSKPPLLCQHPKLYAKGLCHNCYINKYNNDRKNKPSYFPNESHPLEEDVSTAKLEFIPQ